MQKIKLTFMSKYKLGCLTDEQAFIHTNDVDMNKTVCQITWTA